MEKTRLELLLEQLINNGTIEGWECRSRLEEYLVACINKTDMDANYEPRSRLEELLKLLVVSIKNNTTEQPSGQIDIVKNGIVDVLKYASANVNVPIPDGYIVPEGVLEITENGEKDVTNYAKVNVNVASSGEDMLQARININNSCAYLFYKYSGKNVDFISNLDTSNVTDMTNMFYNSSVQTIPYLDTSNVTDMSYMFYGCKQLKTIPALNTSKVKGMTQMFYDCSHQLETVPALDCSNVNNAQNMFYNCKVLTSVSLLNTSKIVSMSNIFYNCVKLIEVTEFDTSSLTGTGANGMFFNCELLETVPKINLKNCTNLTNFVQNCTSLKNITLLNIKVNLQVGSGTTFGHLLTLESLIGLCRECINTGSSKKLTVGSANLEKLASVYVKLTGEAEEDEANPKVPFEVCESTEEGAVTIEDYMLSKNWQLA